MGTLGGLAASPLTALTLERMIYGIEPYDLAVYGGVALLLAAISLVAAAVPALRAARLDPAAALRE